LTAPTIPPPKDRFAASWRKRRLWRILLRIGLVLAIAALAWSSYVQWKIYVAKTSPVPATADVGIVLGASIWHDKPSPGLAERLNMAIQLYREGRFGRIIVSGGMDASGAIVTEAEGMRRYLLASGIPDEAIMLEDRSTSTYENLLFSKEIMAKRGWRSAIIVTHRYHGARALDIATFLDVPNAAVATTDSKVMFIPWHEARETLAFAKWKAQWLLMKLAGG